MEAPIAALEDEGVASAGARTLDALVAALEPPRTIWLMVPAALVGDTVVLLSSLLAPGDVLIDGGNSWYHHDVDRSTALAPSGIKYLDIGTSGGIHGLERGYCLMIGGDTEAVDRLAPIFDTLAPGVDTAERTPGRGGPADARGAGLAALRPERRRPLRQDGAQRHRVRADGGLRRRVSTCWPRRTSAPRSTPSTPRPHRSMRPSTTSTTSTSRRSPRCGGEVRWSVRGCSTSPPRRSTPTRELSEYSGVVSDSGEGRWTINAAIDEGVPVPVLSAALYERFSSRGRADVADKVLSAMRAGFGGHHERTDSTR